jgi:hypothetical protein
MQDLSADNSNLSQGDSVPHFGIFHPVCVAPHKGEVDDYNRLTNDF